MAVEKIQATDSLNDGRVKLNAAIEQSNEAITKATTADENASQAVTTANSVQEQFNQVVIEGDSSVEAAQARVSVTGTTYQTLKERLDQEHESVTTQLAETASKLNNKIHFIKSPDTGDGAVIQLSDGKVLLIDSHKVGNANYVKSYIDALNIAHIDYVVISHYHSDHIGGLSAISNLFNQNTIFYLPQDVNSSVVSSDILTNQINTKAIITNANAIMVYPTENQKINLNESVTLEFVNTNHDIYYASSAFDYNDCSMCCYLRVGNNEVFFSADIALEAQRFLRDKVRPVKIYKGHHHASDDFLDTVFMRHVQPSLVITMDSNDTYYGLLDTKSKLQLWLEANKIPHYPTSRNGDVVLELNETDYRVVSNARSYTTAQKISSFTEESHIDTFMYQTWQEILKDWSNTTTLEEVIEAMKNGTVIQTTISKSWTMCPSFVTSYGAFITITKNVDYAEIFLTDRDPNSNDLWIGKQVKGGNVKFIRYVSPSKTKYRTAGTNYAVNTETKGTIIDSYSSNNNGRFTLSNGNIIINRSGFYEIAVRFSADCKRANSEIQVNVYKNDVLMFTIANLTVLNSFTNGYNTLINSFNAGDVLSIKFKPITDTVSTVNISSDIMIEEV